MSLHKKNKKAIWQVVMQNKGNTSCYECRGSIHPSQGVLPLQNLPLQNEHVRALLK